jgi:hypothetical protein
MTLRFTTLPVIPHTLPHITRSDSRTAGRDVTLRANTYPTQTCTIRSYCGTFHTVTKEFNLQYSKRHYVETGPAQESYFHLHKFCHIQKHEQCYTFRCSIAPYYWKNWIIYVIAVTIHKFHYTHLPWTTVRRKKNKLPKLITTPTHTPKPNAALNGSNFHRFYPTASMVKRNLFRQVVWFSMLGGSYIALYIYMFISVQGIHKTHTLLITYN